MDHCPPIIYQSIRCVVRAIYASSLGLNMLSLLQTWFTSQVAPFASRLVGQVLACPASSASPTHIRWILNDAVVPLTGVNGCEANKDGLCPLDTYISAMQEHIGQMDFAFDCLANYTIPEPDFIVNGRPPASVKSKVLGN